MGMAVTFVMTITAVVSWMINHWILIPYGLDFLQIVSFILVIASLVQLVEIILKKISPPLYQALGIFLPLITTNCAVLGVAVLAVQKDFNLLESVVYAIGNALGFGLALITFSGIREQLDLLHVPKRLHGVPIAFIVAGLMALAFMGFAGIV
jgi:electron transport complex protein RnfA